MRSPKASASKAKELPHRLGRWVVHYIEQSIFQVTQWQDGQGQPSYYIESIQIAHSQTASFEFEDGSKDSHLKKRASTQRYKEATHMKLAYRGTQYCTTAAHVDVVDAPIAGQYRGATVHFHQPVNLLTFQQVRHLIYRGVPFDQAIATPAA